LHEDQHHSAQTHEDRYSRRNDDNSKAINLLDNAINVLLQTGSDALDVVPQTRLNTRNRIADGIGSGTPEWASQCTT